MPNRMESSAAVAHNSNCEAEQREAHDDNDSRRTGHVAVVRRIDRLH